MNIEALTNRVPPEWRSEFKRFVQSGDASKEFFDFLDSDPTCQQAVEEAFAQQAAGFERLAAEMRMPEPVI